jgi:hypothetical protein
MRLNSSKVAKYTESKIKGDKYDKDKKEHCIRSWTLADGSCFSKLIPTLQAEGHEVIAAQNSLDSLTHP